MFSILTLNDGIVTLRPFQLADVKPFHETVCETLDALIPWMSWAHLRYSEDEADEYIRSARRNWDAGTQYVFAVSEARDGAMLGAVSLSHIHPVYHFCNLGYWIRASRHGNGFAGRAARLAAKFAFEQVGLVRVEIVVAVGNEASLKVAEKTGARREGILRNRILVREKVYDGIMFAFVPADFERP